MTEKRKKYRVFYRLKTHDAITDWQEAICHYDEIGINPIPVATIEAPEGVLQAIHWRGRELHRFFEKMLTPVTEIYELKFVLDESDEESDEESENPCFIPSCCEDERRNMNGGCDNCGDPCL